jgi:hypothetical protein
LTTNLESDMPSTVREFRHAYTSEVERLRAMSPYDRAIHDLVSTEEAFENAGTDEYTPDWLGVYVTVAGRVLLDDDLLDESLPDQTMDRVRQVFREAVSHAARLAYTEGYFGRSDDAANTG